MNKIFKFILAINAVIAVTACSSNEDEPEYTFIQLTRSQSDVVNSHNEFAWDFFKETNKAEISDNDSNILISPFSMAIDLSMLANGATDKTLSQLMKVLHMNEDCDIYELNEINKFLTNVVFPKNSQQIHMFNSLWYGKDFSLIDEYKKILSSDYSAECFQTDFSNPKSIEEINSWCSKNTNGLIKNVVKKNDYCDNKTFILLNALLFEGKWYNPFNKENTAKHLFNNREITPVVIEMMKDKKGLAGTWNDDISVIEMSFYGNYVIYCILPNEQGNIDKAIFDLNIQKWNDLRNEVKMHPMSIEVSFPKFSFSYDTNIDDIMVRLGLDINYPSLKKMCDDEIQRIKLTQNCKIELDEDGASIASVSKVQSGITSPSPLEKGKIVFDRPFFFIIEESRSDAILFMGKINAL